MARLKHAETHVTDRIGWLRAAVLGANDGIVSTASLIVGVASAGSDARAVLVAGLAGLVAGALSMAAGEYVSVSSQADAERADLERERRELAEMPQAELDELTQIYVQRGLTPALARQVAEQLSAGDVLKAHARDELGIVDGAGANPIQAALASALSFAVGAVLPLLAVLLVPQSLVIAAVAGVSTLALAALGLMGAKTGGAKPLRATLRVVFWGVLAMAVTSGIGLVFGIAA